MRIPDVLITVEGGMIQDISAIQDIDVMVIDRDNDPKAAEFWNLSEIINAVEMLRLIRSFDDSF